MTEAEWEACNDPDPMLDRIHGPGHWSSGFPECRATRRQLQLWGCACCRLVWELIPPGLYRHAVEVAERFADGLAYEQEYADAQESLEAERRAAGARVEGDVVRWRKRFEFWTPEEAVDWVFRPGRGDAPWVVANCASWLHAPIDVRYALEWEEWEDPEEEDRQARTLLIRRTQERATQSQFLRDIFPRPSGRPPLVDAQWLASRAGLVVPLAQAIYEEREFDRLPLLADALEEAGCTEAPLLGHLRGPGPHVRGCWALDVVLGKS